MRFVLATVAAVAAFAITASSPASAAVTVYTDRAAFLAALSGAAVETDGLGEDVAAGATISLPLGITSANSLGNRLPGDNAVSGGALTNGLAGNGLLASGLNELLLPGGVTAFGADFEGVGGDLPLLDDTSIIASVVVDGVAQSFDLQSLFGGSGEGFFGLISDGHDLGSLLLTAGSGARNAFAVDDIAIAGAVAVPLPASFPLMTTGIAFVLGLSGRRCLG